jgi:hypothetical protein
MKKSKLLLVSWILTLLYLITIVVYVSTYGNSGNDTEQVGAAIAVVLMLPHLVVTLVGLILNVLAWAVNKRGFALAGAILYSVAMFLFPPYFFFILIQTILSYVAYSKMSKISKVAA